MSPCLCWRWPAFWPAVHFEWTFLLVGVVLAIMVVALGFLEQYVVWIVMLPVIMAAGWAYFQVRKRRVKDSAKLS